MSFLHRLNRDAERWLLLVFYVMLVLTMSIEVLRREIFSYSSIWGEEIVRYSFKALLYIFGDLVMFGVAAIALYWSWESVHVSWKFGSVSHGLRISMVWFFMAVPLGFAIMIVRLTQSLLRDMRSLRDGTPVYEGDKLFD